MTLGLPVLYRGRTVGALVALVSLRDMWSLVDRIRLGERGIAYVVSEAGVFLAHTDKRNVLDEVRLSEDQFETMRSDPRGSTPFRDATGGWLVCHARVPGDVMDLLNLEWYVALKQSTEEAYRSSALMRRTLLLTLAAAVVLGSVIVGLTAREIVRPVKILVDGTRRIAREEWDVRIPVRRDDEIGELADAFEGMTGELKRRSDERDRALVSVQEHSAELERANRLLEEQRKKLEEVNVELRKVDRLKSEFLSNVSHELRTPLTSMRIYLDYIVGGRGSDGLNTFQMNALSSIRGSTDRLGTLVEDLLNLSRMEAGRLDLNIEEADLYEVADLAIQEVRARAEKRGIRIDVDFNPGEVWLEADRGRLVQVITNLVGNGVKFTEPGGTVSVRAEYAGDVVRLDVADTGMGIPSHEQEKIFERFHQVGREWSAGEKADGAGLGLAIVRKVVEAHAGTIGVESAPGEGATFTVVLPRRSAESQEVTERSHDVTST